jgi:hypothetical protein
MLFTAIIGFLLLRMQFLLFECNFIVEMELLLLEWSFTAQNLIYCRK